MTMLPDTIYELMRDSAVTLAFDTSVIVMRGFLDLCSQANRINERWKSQGVNRRIRLCVPAAAYAERLFDLAQMYGEDYDVNIPRSVVEQLQIEIPCFTEEDAEHCAVLLVDRYATPEAWHVFKKRRCLECTGLPHEYHHLAEGTGQHCGAPCDWLIIAQASHGNMLLVMDDPGRHGEYDEVKCIVRSVDVRAALDQLFDELSRQSPIGP